LLKAKLIIYEPDATLIPLPLSTYVTDEASAQNQQANLKRAEQTHTPLVYQGVAWLGARVPSSISLSASAFVQARAASVSSEPNPFYGFADPVISKDPRAFARVKATTAVSEGVPDTCADVRRALFRLDTIDDTAGEVKAIADSLRQGSDAYSLGNAFTDEAVLRMGSKPEGASADSQLHRYRVLYFATHGVLWPNCLQPALVTSLGSKPSDDALLGVAEIPSLDLDADIVVLSACDTGKSQGAGAEAVGGLVTTFVEAGARNVVVSNWEVDSEATERLMTAMFGSSNLQQADALAQAQRAMMSSNDELSNPFYWAPFTIVGDGARPMPKPPGADAPKSPTA
jgi:CHAT domain-containing protein